MNSNPLYSYIEDPAKSEAIQKPVYHQHVAYHPQQTDGIFSQLWACRDVFADHHWHIGNAFSYGFQGALLGVFLGSVAGLPFKNISTFQYKRIFKYVKENYFGSLKIARNIFRPYLIGGFVGGFGWFVWNNLIFNPQNETRLGKTFWSTALYGSAISTVLWHPQYAGYGFLIGGALGIAQYLITSNRGANNQASGIHLLTGNLSDEHRTQQYYKDYIAAISAHEKMIKGKLVDL